MIFSSPTRGQTRTPCIGRQNLWATREVPTFPFLTHMIERIMEQELWKGEKLLLSIFDVLSYLCLL